MLDKYLKQSTPEQQAEAIALIIRYQHIAIQVSQIYQKIYPYQDVEPRVFQGLYLAAYTYNNKLINKKGSQVKFYTWFRIKVRGQMSLCRKTTNRWNNHLKRRGLDVYLNIDNFYYYLEEKNETDTFERTK